jgi:ArsR family transcriptional regulator, arsenate/arsenite/antimonite-responsive transcriptional repressor
MTKSALTLSNCAPSSASEPIARANAEDTATLLKAVADPTRLQILAIIARAENKESCVCDLAEPLGLSQPTISHHLKKLAEVDLVEKQRRGTWIWYSLNNKRWNQIAELFS